MSTDQIDPFSPNAFNLYLDGLLQSETYALFCEKVYGRNLSQFNALDENQLQFLISNINQLNPQSILELGCGIGKITEFLSQNTSAKILGIDFADKMITVAKIRHLDKLNLDFKTGDFNDLPKELGQHDLILAIDTLCFAENLNKTILNLRSHLTNQGTILIFHSYRNKNLGASSPLTPEQSKIGTALSQAGFVYSTFDFTESEKCLWQEALNVSFTLKEKFEKENHGKICEDRIWEAQRNLSWYNQGIYRRTLFIANKLS